MKNGILLALAFMATFQLTSCAQQPTVSEMLENKETREEIYTAILNDDAMMTEFMDHMQADDRVMNRMRGHGHMMGRMMEDEDAFATMMDRDEQFRNHMMTMMMNHQPWMTQMMNQMHQRGFMSQECLDAMRERMEQPGMDNN
jgi:hypothetical protein